MKAPGRKRNRITLGVIAAAAISAGSYYGVKTAMKENPFLNFDVVEPGVLLRSGEPRIGDIEDIYEDYGIRTIICLNDDEDSEIEDFAKEHGIKIVCLRMRAAEPPMDEQAELFFEIMADGEIGLEKYKDVLLECLGCSGRRVEFEKPVLIHCLGGSDRTGIMVALYRVQFQGWSKDRAKREMMLHFHNPLRYPAQLDFLDDFEPRPGFP